MNAIMTDFDRHRTGEPHPGNWEGFSEIDQAIRENRLMEYRIKKSWADPWGRKLTIWACFVIVARVRVFSRCVIRTVVICSQITTPSRRRLPRRLRPARPLVTASRRSLDPPIRWRPAA